MVFRFPTAQIIIVFGVFICSLSLFVSLEEKVDTVSPVDSGYPILIIDPGHGGEDGGAVGINGERESEINLTISLKLNSLCHLYGVRTVMTRDSEEIEYPDHLNSTAERKKADQEMRLRLIRDNPNAILYSIHQNYYPSRVPSGIQVLYGHDENSKAIGVMLHSNLQSLLCPNSRRVACEIDDDIFLLKHCNCTAALIECGFLSNPTELKLLKDDHYQTKVAMILVSSYMQYIAYNL